MRHHVISADDVRPGTFIVEWRSWVSRMLCIAEDNEYFLFLVHRINVKTGTSETYTQLWERGAISQQLTDVEVFQ